MGDVDDAAPSVQPTGTQRVLSKIWVVILRNVLPVITFIGFPPLLGLELSLSDRFMAGIWSTLGINALIEPLTFTGQPVTRVRKIAAVAGGLGALCFVPMSVLSNDLAVAIFTVVGAIALTIGIVAQFRHTQEIRARTAMLKRNTAEG